MSTTQPTSIVLSPKAKEVLRIMEEEMGLSKSKVIEVAVRALAKLHKIAIPKDSWFPKKQARRDADRAPTRKRAHVRPKQH